MVLGPWLYGHQCALSLYSNLSVRLISLWKTGGSPAKRSVPLVRGCPLAGSRAEQLSASIP